MHPRARSREARQPRHTSWRAASNRQESLLEAKLHPEQPGAAKKIISPEAMNQLVREVKLI
ncbi:MAG TPA: hypothetical protein VNZ64_22985 [Candidatus Acidoferrum sp.]|nr:hypothetical protein [Candidatus Acidoferrum sp.]